MGGPGSGRRPDPVKVVLGSNLGSFQPTGNDIILPDYSGVAAHKKTQDTYFLKSAFNNAYLELTNQIQWVDINGNILVTIQAPAEDQFDCTAKFYNFGEQNDAQDVTFSFTALTNDGQFKWSESNDRFEFSDDIFLSDGEWIYFGDTNNFVKEASNIVTVNGQTRAVLAAGGTTGVQVTTTTTTCPLPMNITNSLQCDSIVNDTGLAAGTYSPTLTGVANVAASTSYTAQYMRVGNTVTVSGKVDVDPTAAVATQLGISLPIASNFANSEECGGVAFASGIAGQGAAIRGDATNNRAEMVWVAVDVTNQPMHYSFTYQVI